MKETSIIERFREVVRNNLPLVVIVVATVLMVLAMGGMYYAAQKIVQRDMEQLVERDMNAIYLRIRNQLSKVEVTLDNMAWVVVDDLRSPDSLISVTRQLVQHNPVILGSSATCIPNYYPEKGYWYEPYAVRRDDGTIETMQLGSADHDYTKMEFFTAPIAKGGGHWCEPYFDKEGARAMVTTYGVPVRDGAGKTVAVIDADISLQWLEKVIDESKVYKSTKRFLVTGSDHLLAGKETPIFHSAMKLVEAYAHKQGYEVIEDENGEMHHVFFHPVGGKTDWVLISILKDTEVFDQLRQVRHLMSMLILAGMLAACFIVYRSLRHLERLRKVNAEQDRINTELRVAGRIQQSMLPHDYQKVDDVDICGILLPAREVGGDLYDYFIRDEKLFFCIGDVSGKGAPAAMVMGVVHSLFRAFAAHETSAAHIMQGINEGTCQGNESNFFVTMFVGVLDLPTGHLRYCDAGHDAPIVLGKEQKRMLPCNPHLPVGVLDTIKYEEQETQLSPGDALFLYTDGLTEARNATNQLFGMNRVNVTLDKCFSLKPEEMLQRVIDDVCLYVTDAEQSDDLTLLALRYTPQSFESVISETLVIKNNVREMPKFGEFVKSMFGKMGLDKSMSRNIRLAVEEAVVNVMNYAYPAGEEGEIEIRLMSDGTVLRTVIIDSGVAFDPTIEKKADTSLPPEERQIGGLGILLYRELMDSINYEREGGKNILTLNKQL
jgi:sigma-B regulation protein RsbU (phosphoserine phosphatase)